MRYKYTIEIDTDTIPIMEQRITHIMSEFFKMVNEKPIPKNVLKIVREDLPEKTLEERIEEKKEQETD